MYKTVRHIEVTVPYSGVGIFGTARGDRVGRPATQSPYSLDGM